MSYQGQVYQLMDDFNPQQYTDAENLVCTLAPQGTQTILAVFRQYYKVWTDLSYAIAPHTL